MDLGLGEILRHFEEHFGKLATKALLGIISLAVLGACLRLIWENILYPVYIGVHWIISGNHFQIPTANVILSSIITGLSAVIIYYAAVRLIAAYLNVRLYRIASEGNKLTSDFNKISKELVEKTRDLKEVRSQCEALLEKLEKNGIATQSPKLASVYS